MHVTARITGFTVLELVYVVVIAGIVLGLGVPTLRDVTLEARRATAAGSLVAALRFARNEAQLRARPILWCLSLDRRQCAAGAGDGWIVFDAAEGSEPAAPDATAMPLRVGALPQDFLLTTNRAVFEFRPFPRRSTNGTIDICDPRGTARSIAVIVSYSGRPRLADAALGRCGGPG